MGVAAGCEGDAACRPVESNTRVFTSPSPPCGGMSWPFQRNDTAAAFPTFTTNFCEARNVGCAGAMRVSSVRGWPSAEIEIQEFSVARTVSTSEPEDFAVDLAG